MTTTKLSDHIMLQQKEFVQTIKELLSGTLLKYFEEFETCFINIFAQIPHIISSHPFYVMFEQLLNCDPSNDHECPKNVFPIFRDQFKLLEQQITIKFNDKQKHINEELINLILPHLTKVHQQNLHVLKYIQLAEQQFDETKLQTLQLNQKLAEQFIIMKKAVMCSQLQKDAKKRYGNLYKPDFTENLSFKLEKEELFKTNLVDFDQFAAEQTIEQLKEDMMKQDAEILKLTLLVKNTHIFEDFEKLQRIKLDLDKQIMTLKEQAIKQQDTVINYQKQVDILNNQIKLQQLEKIEQMMRIESMRAKETQTSIFCGEKEMQTDKMQPEIVYVEKQEAESSSEEIFKPSFLKLPPLKNNDPDIQINDLDPNEQVQSIIDINFQEDIAQSIKQVSNSQMTKQTPKLEISLQSIINQSSKQKNLSMNKLFSIPMSSEVKEAEMKHTTQVQDNKNSLTQSTQILQLQQEHQIMTIIEQQEITIEQQRFDNNMHVRDVGCQNDDIEVVDYTKLYDYINQLESDLKKQREKYKTLKSKSVTSPVVSNVIQTMSQADAEMQTLRFGQNQMIQTDKLVTYSNLPIPNIKQEAKMIRHAYMNKFQKVPELEKQKILEMKKKAKVAKEQRELQLSQLQKQVEKEYDKLTDFGFKSDVVDQKTLRNIKK